MIYGNLMAPLAGLAFATSVPAQSWQLSGGADGRITVTDFRPIDPVMKGVFLNGQNIFRDEMGDRWLASYQVDWKDNFRDLLPYQTFLQYKGPLGKWNIRAGHFLLPFSLQSEYDTERLLFRTIEEEMTGTRLDWGGGAFGYAGDFTWSTAVTSGLGEEWPVHAPDGVLFTARLAYARSSWSVGSSFLSGIGYFAPGAAQEGFDLHQQKIALDLSAFLGQWIIRTEGIGGRDGAQAVAAVNVLIDYAWTRFLEINGKAAVLQRESLSGEAGLGLTLSWRSFKARLADSWLSVEGHNGNRAEAQIYYDFSKSL